MKEQLVTKEVAELAKEAGFSWYTPMCFLRGKLGGTKMGMGDCP